MCLSEAVSIVILALPDLSTDERLSSFGLLDRDMPDTGLLATAEKLVADLLHPFRNVRGRSLVGRQQLELVTHVCQLDPADQLHQRARAEAPAGVDQSFLGHRALPPLCQSQNDQTWVSRAP